MIKCIDFEINCCNSDAECSVVDTNYYGEESILSKIKLMTDPSMCDRCPYNEKFKDYNYYEWEVELRNINIDRIID
tara:strand:+ start:58049 stop:58276 length:228 start_codon:yes stop_codon:yes gene_type:complete